MIFGRRKDRPPRATNPAWLKWMVMLFIGYTVFLNYSERKDNSSAPTDGQAVQNLDDNAIATSANYGSFLLPASVTIGDEIAGQGAVARCGQTANVTIRELLQDAPAQALDITEVQVGISHDAEHIWPIAVTGMQPSGTRNINVALKQGDATIIKRYQVMLNDVQPQSSKEFIAFQAMDRVTGRKAMAECGDTVAFKLTLYGNDGAVRYASDEVHSLRIGEKSYMYGLHRAMLGMREGGVRTAIIPAGFMSLSDDTPAALKEAVAAHMIGIVEITMQSITKTPQ